MEKSIILIKLDQSSRILIQILKIQVLCKTVY